METFAEYILNEEDLFSKMEITYYLAQKTRIFFDKSVVFKTEMARMFIDYMKIDVDKNWVLTACLLSNCKKIDNAQDLEKIHTYAKRGAEYLSGLGFSAKFCKMCEEINRYSNSNPRERESDILELVDQFGGMLLDRPERIGLNTDEALVLLEHRNLKDQYNRFLYTFEEFIKEMEAIEINDIAPINSLKLLVKIYRESEDVKAFIKSVCNEYEPKVDEAMAKHDNEIKRQLLQRTNRPLFSEETTKKILAHIANQSEENNI